MTVFRSVCVFAGSSPGSRSVYREAALGLGREIVRQGMAMVFGGSRIGLMGTVADAVLAEGGEVRGVITEALVEHEIAHQGLTQLEIVPTMHERKARMADLADGFVMLPGGFGTCEEFVEAVTWTQLGIHAKPCGVLNVAGFFDPLLAFFDRAVEDRFIRPENAQIVRCHEDPALLLADMQAFRPVGIDKWLDRADR